MIKQQGIRQVSFVPDAGHAELIGLCEGDRELRAVRLTTEEEGIALAVGAWLGGDKSVLLMQSSGVGNCINMASMLSACLLWNEPSGAWAGVALAILLVLLAVAAEYMDDPAFRVSAVLVAMAGLVRLYVADGGFASAAAGSIVNPYSAARVFRLRAITERCELPIETQHSVSS